jgi:hypothetical protein
MIESRSEDWKGGDTMCAVCKNAVCPLSYRSHDGRVLLQLIRTLEENHSQDRTPAPAVITRLRELVPKICQAGAFCSVGDCGRQLAKLPGPNEPDEVNCILSNIELLNVYGVM